MIQSIRHQGLRRFHATGRTAGIQPSHARKLRKQLVALETAITIEDMNLPGLRLHPLVGAERGRWAIWVNGNWALTFEFQGGKVYVLDDEDDH